MKMATALALDQAEARYSLQEKLLLIWLLVVVSVFVVGLSMLIHFVLLAEPRFSIGKLNDFAELQPQRVNLQTDLSVYVVKLNHQLHVWDTMPAAQPLCSRIQWVAANQRFEDPCLAGKWCLDGSIADLRIPGIHILTEYPTRMERDGTVTI
ncbi:hypothetical protein BH10CHL1_BH10CHL1_46770 [soil metagenome]